MHTISHEREPTNSSDNGDTAKHSQIISAESIKRNSMRKQLQKQQQAMPKVRPREEITLRWFHTVSTKKIQNQFASLNLLNYLINLKIVEHYLCYFFNAAFER